MPVWLETQSRLKAKTVDSGQRQKKGRAGGRRKPIRRAPTASVQMAAMGRDGEQSSSSSDIREDSVQWEAVSEQWGS